MYRKSNSAQSFKPNTQNHEKLKSVTEQLKVYTEKDHLERKSDDVKELYETFKTAILNLSDDIEVEYRKEYIAFRKNSNFADINV